LFRSSSHRGSGGSNPLRRTSGTGKPRDMRLSGFSFFGPVAHRDPSCGTLCGVGRDPVGCRAGTGRPPRIDESRWTGRFATSSETSAMPREGLSVSFVPAHEIINRAYRDGYAVGAFNDNNMEIVQASIEAAEAERAPVIMQASQGAIKYAGIRYIVALARTAAEEASVPVALHLDHGTDFEQVMACIRYGFSSVMYDGSHHPLEENIAETARIVEIAHAVGVSVEGEIGRLVGIEDDIAVSELEAALTDPEQAARFA